MAEQPSRQVLDSVPGRVLTFLLGVGKYFAIRTALASRGYTQAHHEIAWDHLKRLGEEGCDFDGMASSSVNGGALIG